MFIRKYWLPLTVFIVAIVGVGLYLHLTQPPPEPVTIYKPVEPLEKPTEAPVKETEAPIGDTSQGGHFHADGTWHAQPHEEVVSLVEAPYKTTVEINHEWASLTDEERLQREKAANQVLLNEIAGNPIFAELYTLMTENPFPYSPEVETKIHQENMRISQRGVEYDLAFEAIDKKMRDPNISAREFGRLIRERVELRNRYKGGE